MIFNSEKKGKLLVLVFYRQRKLSNKLENFVHLSNKLNITASTVDHFNDIISYIYLLLMIYLILVYLMYYFYALLLQRCIFEPGPNSFKLRKNVWLRNISLSLLFLHIGITNI